MKAMRVTLLASVLVLAVSAPSLVAQERPLPEIGPFLAEVKQRLQTDEQLQSRYVYVETRHQSKLDKNGRSTKESVKVLESYPGLPGEERWERLVSEDGKPVPADDLAKRDRERQKKAQEYVRRLEKEPEKVRREQLRKREEYAREMKEFADDLFVVYDIRMVGREALDGHDTIVFDLIPRPASKPRRGDSKYMKKFNARAWVSESEYELVRVDVEAIDTVSVGLGFLARVHKGARASFTRRKVNGEVWLPARFSYTASARLGLVKMMRVGGESEYSDYRKFTVGTSTTFTTQR